MSIPPLIGTQMQPILNNFYETTLQKELKVLLVNIKWLMHIVICLLHQRLAMSLVSTLQRSNPDPKNTEFQTSFNNTIGCLSSPQHLAERLGKKLSWKLSFPISIYYMATGTVLTVKSKLATQKHWPEVGNGLYSSRYCSPCSIYVKKSSAITKINIFYGFPHPNCSE